MRTEEGDHHIVGYDIDLRDLRASSAILQISFEQRRGITQTGQVYELRGAPDRDPHAGYAWQLWMSVNEATEAVDITERLLSGQTAIRTVLNSWR